MSFSSSNDVPEFNSTQDELVYWKNRSQQFEQENRLLKLKRSIKCVIGDDQENTEKDPVKKNRIDDRYEMDPFKLFPQHCQEIMLNQLNGMDLYNMSKVSEYWKLIVKSDKKAADKLKKVVTISSDDMADRVQLISDRIDYVHAEFSNDCFDLACLFKYSASLETIKISDCYGQNSYDQTDTFSKHLNRNSVQHFSNLQKLDVDFYEPLLIFWLSHCTFPALRELKLNYSRINEELDFEFSMYISYTYSMNFLYKNAPNLKHLHLRGDTMNRLLHFKIYAQCRLQSLSLPEFYGHMIEYNAQTLTNFSIEQLSMRELIFILKNLSKLETLTIGWIIKKNEKSLPLFIHAGITNFKYLNNGNFPQNAPLVNIISLVNLMPSLETVIMDEKLTVSQLRFMAHNHLYLKEISCSGIEENLMEAYEDLKHDESEDVEINKNIKIVKD